MDPVPVQSTPFIREESKWERVKSFLSSVKYLFGGFLTIALVGGLVGSVFLSQQKQDIHQHAYDTSWPGNIYFGVVVPNLYGGSLFDLTSFEQMVNKRVSIVLNYYSWNITSQNGGWQLDTNFLNTVRNHGSIPMVAWYSREDASSDQSAYQLRNIYNGKFDGYIRRWATDAKNWGHPFFLRFDSEMNGDWTAWCDCSNGNSKGDYVKAWRHVHDIFTQVGATNVMWVWDVNIEFAGISSINYLYPGDVYVDWVGMNGYNNGTAFSGSSWQSFYQVFYQTYVDLQAITSKPIMIGEMGSAEKGGNKANWISDMLYAQLVTNFTKVKAVIWFDLNKETDWRVDSSTTSLQAFKDAIQEPMYAQNTFGDVSSPITPLKQVGTRPTQLYADCSKNTSVCGGMTCSSVPFGSGKGCEVQTWGDCSFGAGACAGGLTCATVDFGTQRACVPHSSISTPTPTNTRAPTPTPIPTSRPTPTSTPTPTGSPTPTLTGDPSRSPTPTPSASPTSTPKEKVGDINHDGVVNIVDYRLLMDCYGSKFHTASCTAGSAADLNGDGVVDGIDYNILLRAMIGNQ